MSISGDREQLIEGGMNPTSETMLDRTTDENWIGSRDLIRTVMAKIPQGDRKLAQTLLPHLRLGNLIAKAETICVTIGSEVERTNGKLPQALWMAVDAAQLDLHSDCLVVHAYPSQWKLQPDYEDHFKEFSSEQDAACGNQKDKIEATGLSFERKGLPKALNLTEKTSRNLLIILKLLPQDTPIGHSRFGIEAGHWKQQVITGQQRQLFTFFEKAPQFMPGGSREKSKAGLRNEYLQWCQREKLKEKSFGRSSFGKWLDRWRAGWRLGRSQWKLSRDDDRECRE